MTDYGHDLLFGVFVPPVAARHPEVIALVRRADEIGLDLVGIQDHPYQPAYLDTWTLLSALATQTQRIRLFPDVVNLSMRSPVILARSAASLDLLSNGRVELGIGAGAFADAVVANGGPRRSPAESVDALEEAVVIIRALWEPGGSVRYDGEHYSMRGAKSGPVPGHPIGLWVGAYGRRMLRLTGRLGDGWIPSLGYLPPEKLPAANAVVDDAALEAGRKPSDIRRLLNIGGTFQATTSGPLDGPPESWAESLSEMALESGVSGFVLAVEPDAVADVERFANEVAPDVRERVDRARRSGLAPTETRPSITVKSRDEPSETSAEGTTPEGRANQQLLLQVHQHLRDELATLRRMIAEIEAGESTTDVVRDLLGRLTLRQNFHTLGMFCLRYCRTLSSHHMIEDTHLLPDLLARDPSLAPVIDRLQADHEEISGMIDELDKALENRTSDDLTELGAIVDRVESALHAHLAYEEQELLGLIGRG